MNPQAVGGEEPAEVARSTAHPFDDLDLRPGEDLVAVGGRLGVDVLVEAYRHGVFPWYDAGQPVLWWCPDPRTVLPLGELHVPRRLDRTIRSGRFEVRVDQSFEAVVRGCAEARAEGTWIHEDVVRAYVRLHRSGHAHSVEVHEGGRLVGGLYGVAAGGAFAAESKFHRVRDASKIALVALARRLVARGFTLLDVQFLTPHLARFGCVEIPRAEYLARLRAAVDLTVSFA
jgi:leucyl/phenylalanyl-tRNA--protein transferase